VPQVFVQVRTDERLAITYRAAEDITARPSEIQAADVKEIVGSGASWRLCACVVLIACRCGRGRSADAYHTRAIHWHRHPPPQRQMLNVTASRCLCPGAKSIQVSSRNGDLLLEIEAADEAQRDLWVSRRYGVVGGGASTKDCIVVKEYGDIE
jgi:hypothetical protein